MQDDASGQIHCQHCGTPAPADRTMCPACRRRLRAGAPAVLTPELQQMMLAEAAQQMPPPPPPPWPPPEWEAPASRWKSDLGESIALCRRSPALVVLTVILGALPLTLAHLHGAAARSVSIVVIPVELYAVGFAAAQRIWLLRLSDGGTLGAADVWGIPWRYFGRFLRLYLLVGWPAGVAVVAATSYAAASDHPGHAAWIVTALLVVWGAGLDVALTFVVPDLTFGPPSAGAAWRSGRALLSASWPQSRWYVLSPGLFAIALGNGVGRLVHGPWLGSALGAVSGLFALVMRGTIQAYYLRLRPEVKVSAQPVQHNR